jgi:hypothetical protein
MISVAASAEKSTDVGAYRRAIFNSLPARGKFSLRAKLFELARRLKDTGREIDAETLDKIADEWHRAAGEVVAGVEPDEVRAKLKKSFAKCRYGLEAVTLATEFAKRKAEPLSEAARKFTRNPNVRDTVIAIEAAARLNGGGEFPLSQRRLGELLGVSQPRAGEYLATLIEAGVIVQTGGYVKGKWPKSYRLIAVVKSIAEKIRDTLGALVGFFGRLVGSATTTSFPTEPSEPAKPTEPQAKAERAWWEADPNEAPYEPYMVASGTTRPSRERDGPKKQSRRETIEPEEARFMEDCGIDSSGYAIKKR